MINCPNCYEDQRDNALFINGKSMLANIWECQACNEYFDRYWNLQREVCWVVEPADVIDEYKFLYEIKNQTDLLELESGPSCICCDLPPRYCQVYTDPKASIFETDLQDYMRENGITTDSVYSTGFSDCFACLHFKENTCVPLRNMIRIYHEIEVLPHFSLSTCHSFEQEHYGTTSTPFPNSERGNQFLATAKDEYMYLDAE